MEEYRNKLYEVRYWDYDVSVWEWSENTETKDLRVSEWREILRLRLESLWVSEILRCRIQSVYMMLSQLRLWLESLSARWNTYELREWDWDFRVCMRDVKRKTKNLWMCWLWDKNTQRLCVWGEILRLKLGNWCMRRDIEIELGTVCVCSKVGD